MYWKKLCQHCSKNNYLGILTLIKQRLKRFASFSADGNNCSPLNERGGGGGVLLHINIDHLSLQLSARQLIRLLGFSTICCLVLLTGEAKFNLGRLSHPSHHLSSSSTQKSLSPHRNGWAIAGCACWPGKAVKPWVIGGPRAPPCRRFFLAPLPKSRLLARFAKLLSRSPVSIFDCDEAEELPAGWRTSPKSAAPGLVTPVDEGWPKTVEKSDTKGVDEVEEGNAEEFEGGNALVGVEEKPSNASNPKLAELF